MRRFSALEHLGKQSEDGGQESTLAPLLAEMESPERRKRIQNGKVCTAGDPQKVPEEKGLVKRGKGKALHSSPTDPKGKAPPKYKA